MLEGTNKNTTMTNTTFEVKHGNKDFDITTFLKLHPGGINYIENYKGKDVTEKMKLAGHSEAAWYLLKKYQKDGRDEFAIFKENSGLEFAIFKENSGHFQGEFRTRICYFQNLVDWSKPILAQVPYLGTNYKKWVYLPVDRQIRLFKYDFIEKLTVTPWYTLLIMWPPILTWLMFDGHRHYMEVAEDNTNFRRVYMSFILGFFSWTLSEYLIHRYVFHMETNGSKWKIFVHFMAHGMHHKAPFDTRRLVFPPVPSLLLFSMMITIIRIVVPNDVYFIFSSGFFLSYLMYDLMHYYIHAGNPKEGSYMYKFKRIHNYHHFRHVDKGYGLTYMSYSIWDKIWGTTIKLKNLKMGIKWQ